MRMTHLMLQALLFDNDGTLVSSLVSVHRCWTRWAVEYGITAEEFGRVELHGRPAAEIAADLLPAARRAARPSRGSRSWRWRTYRTAVCGCCPAPRAFLGALPAERWAVVTSATRRLAEARLGPWASCPRP